MMTLSVIGINTSSTYLGILFARNAWCQPPIRAPSNANVMLTGTLLVREWSRKLGGVAIYLFRQHGRVVGDSQWNHYKRNCVFCKKSYKPVLIIVAVIWLVDGVVIWIGVTQSHGGFVIFAEDSFRLTHVGRPKFKIFLAKAGANRLLLSTTSSGSGTTATATPLLRSTHLSLSLIFFWFRNIDLRVPTRVLYSITLPLAIEIIKVLLSSLTFVSISVF